MSNTKKPRRRTWRRLGTLAGVLVLLGVVVTLNYLTEEDPRARRRVLQTTKSDRPDGIYSHYRPRDRTTGSLTAEQQAEIERLEAIGYASGTEAPPIVSGVTVYDKARTDPGLFLYTSGHGPEGILINMEGDVVHKWECPFERAFPETEITAAMTVNAHHWRHAHLLDDGAVLVIFEACGLFKVDKDSNLIWAQPGLFHHDLDVTEDGTIYALLRKAHLVPRIDEDFAILEDFICVLDPDGIEIQRHSVLELLERSGNEEVVDSLHGRGDILHTNTVKYLDGSLADRSPIFKKGNVLISCRENDTVAIVDLDAGRAVWAACGPWDAQHSPRLLPNGHVIVFDNLGLGDELKQSRILEMDPLNDEVVWTYGEGASEAFFSSTVGLCQPLANGNILVVESQNGTAFEVAPDKTVVWEYVSPFRAGDNNEYIASLLSMRKIDPDAVSGWLEPSD